MKNIKAVVGLWLISLVLFVACNLYAQSGLPPLPTPPAGELLDAWDFSGSNFLSFLHSAPMSFTNVLLVPDWAGTGLQVDDTNAAWITYDVVEPSGHTNLDLAQGTVEMWFSPDWNTTDGIGNWGTLLQVGAWNTNLSAATGAWGFYISPDASTIYFSAQTNGVFTNYLNAPIVWYAGDWHQIDVTYSATNSTLYLEGAFVTNGPGISVVPGAEVLSNGFSIGSDGNTGLLQSRGVFNNLFIFNYQLDAGTISNNYAYDSQIVFPLPSSGGFHTDDGPPSPGGGYGTNSGGGSGGYEPAIETYGSNDFWIQALPLGTNAYNNNTNFLTLILHGTIVDTAYQILSTTNLASPVIWAVEQNLIGSAITNFTPTTVYMPGRPMLFFEALAYTLDSDGDGLPDWWELKYSTTGFPLSPTNADTGNTGTPDGYKQDSAGDGYNNLQKYQMGVPPGTWVTPAAPTGLNAVLSTNGTSATLTWNASAGAVQSYTIYGFDDETFEETTNIVSASQTSFTDSSSVFSDGIIYSIQVNYSGGSSAAWEGDSIIPFQTAALSACLVHGPNREMDLALINVPFGTTGILLSLTPNYNCGWGNGSNLSETIPITSFTNGLYSFSETEYPLYTAYTVAAKAVTPTSEYDLPVVIESDCDRTIRYPFLDASSILKDNLIFTLQAQSAVPSDTNFSPVLLPQCEGQGLGSRAGYSTIVPVYAFASFRPAYLDDQFYPPGNPIWTPDAFPLHPWEINYTMNNGFVYNATIPSCYCLTNLISGSGSGGIGPYLEFSIYSAFTFDSSGFALSQETNTCPSALPSATNRAIDNEDPLSPETFNLYGGYSDPVTDTVNAAPNAYGLAAQGSYLDYITDYTEVTNFLSAGAAAPYPVYGCWEQNAAPEIEAQFYQFTTGGNIISLSPDIVGLSGGVAVTNLLIVGVGDPGFSVSAWLRYHLVNGNSGVYAYAEQYFDKAYKMDTNGNVTTNETGVLSPYGYFFPTEPGPVALVTRTNIENGETGTGVVQVIRLALDANHDGTMDTTFAGPDNTSASQPFAFWINNDDDEPADILDPDRDINSPGTPDYLFINGFYDVRQIRSQRDLEDYARLWICGMPALWASNGYQVTLSWTNVVSGNPVIELFNSVETNGGTGYLTDTNVAAAQVSTSGTSPGLSIGSVKSGTLFTFPNNFFTSNTSKYLLFDGASVGNGQLALTITQNGTNIASTSVFINLMDVTNMFEHAHIAGVTNVLPGNAFSASTYVEDNTLPPEPTEDTNLVLLVHGWRMGEWDYKNFSETMFKRLYWQGYHGRFMSLRWPTLSSDDFWLPLLDYTTYNSSEFIAWRSGAGLSAYLTHLKERFPSYSLNVCSHSMGGIVMAEALRLQLAASQQNVRNYVLMQAAVPASCYDPSFTNYAPFLAAEISEPTPNTYQGYPGAISNAVSGHIVDFFNTNDYALVTGTLGPINTSWEGNQETFKPDSEQDYRVDGTGTNCANGFNTITNSMEIMAFCARPRTKAVGATPGVGGVIYGAGQIDLTASFNFRSGSDQHSAEFNWDIQQVGGFYRQLGISLGVLPVL